MVVGLFYPRLPASSGPPHTHRKYRLPGKIGGILKILSSDKVRETMAELLATTRYFPKADAKKDKYGMPVVAPERADPDDE